MMIVNILGPAGTFGHECSILCEEWLTEQFGDVKINFVESNPAALKLAVYTKCVAFIPIWNPDAGLVKAVIAFLLSLQHHGLKSSIIGVRKLKVKHHLLVHPSVTRRGQVKDVLSHSHALAQCSEHLDAFKLWTRKSKAHGKEVSTAGAAKLVATDRRFRRTAAIASQLAADIYSLRPLASNIHDSPENYTRFSIWGPKPTEPTNQDRTAVIFRTPNEPGRLWKEIGPIQAEHSNLSTIRQISADDAPESAFYCEFDGHRYNDSGRRILREMGRAGQVMVLGSWPV